MQFFSKVNFPPADKYIQQEEKSDANLLRKGVRKGIRSRE